MEEDRKERMTERKERKGERKVSSLDLNEKVIFWHGLK